MTLNPGARLGPYQVVGPIGAGGMGEVYRARDTRLDRTVALKILPAAFSSDPELRARFEREARAIAALSHPHICTVHDVGRHDGTDYIVMELIEGRSLADRLEAGPLPIAEALRYASEIADALDSAHRAGIVHRDLKPANVMVTKTGVKLVDFGLAKATSPLVDMGQSVMPTTPANLTVQGTILGTLQYMAPEQIEGAVVDARSDIFAFGAVLYEMVTGRKAFTGKSPASVMGAVLKEQPPAIGSLQPLAPRGLERIVTTCLAKDPDDRWQTARDLARELRWVRDASGSDSSVTGGTPIAQQRGSRVSRPLAAALLFGAIAVAGVVGRYTAPSPAAGGVTRLAFPAPRTGFPVISDDGRLIVYNGPRSDGTNVLYARRLDQLTAVPIPGTEHSTGSPSLALSPDGESVAFTNGRQIRRVPLSGGPGLVISDLTTDVSGLSWGADDLIVVGTLDGLFRVPASGGTPVRITSLGETQGDVAHRHPALLPDGQTVVFTLSRGSNHHVAIVPLSGGTPLILLPGSHPRLTSAGYLVFNRGSTLWVAEFDTSAGRVVGEPTPVLENVTNLLAGRAAFDIAGNGTLVYLPRPSDVQQLVWVAPNGRTTPAVTERVDGVYHGPPAVSPDGRRLAVTLHPANGRDQIVVYDLVRGTRAPLAALDHLSGTTTRWPVWTTDGARLTFASERDGSWDIFEVAASGGGEPEPLFVAPGGQSPASWSAGDRMLLFEQSNGGPRDIWSLPRGGTAVPVTSTPGVDERDGALHPSRDWLLYSSDEVRGRTEIFVRPYPESGSQVQVTTTGGQTPMWAPDGRHVFYAGLDLETIWSVAVTFTPAPVFGPPTEIARVRLVDDGSRSFTRISDGRLLVLEELGESRPFVVVQNWFEELRARLRRR
jgi:Tol biopolymer transport system component/predicted Ser/Thr protein kinase